jgi:Tetratricopeptide repeat
METSKTVLGQEHPHTLSSMNNLALTYLDQECWKEAEELKVQVMEIRKIVLGREHPYTLSSMNNLALTYLDQERCPKRPRVSHRPCSLNVLLKLPFCYRFDSAIS